ncbi:MAG: RNA polymerase sigma factor, partial [Gemmataceae bacterium]
MTDLDRHQLRPLLDRAAAGDRDALNDLLGRLRPYLHAVVRQTLGGEWKDASDVVQSSLRRINENIDDLLGDDPTVPHLLAWIKKIVRNRAIDEARRRGRAARFSHDSALSNLPEGETPAARAAREARALAVLNALSRLPERQRQVVELHYFDRLRDEEIR